MGADVPPEISVSRTDVEPNLTRFLVVVSDADGTTSEHVVTLSNADRDRLATGHANPGSFVQACFEFLLERERKESILPTFDISQIETYFPEFAQEIGR